MVSRGKSKRKREVNLRLSQNHAGERLPPAPAKGTGGQSVPAKLRRIMQLRAAISEGEKGHSKLSGGGQQGSAARGGGGDNSSSDKLKHDDTKVGEGKKKRKRKGEGEATETTIKGKEEGGDAARKWRKGESLVRLFDEERERKEVARDRRKRFLTLKKKKKLPGRGAGGSLSAVSIPFGEVVMAPPKLTAAPKQAAMLGEDPKQRVNASTAAAKILGAEGGGVHHFPESMGSKAANLERLRTQAVDNYRKRKGWKAPPLFAESHT